MENASYIGLSRQDALRRQLSVVANNIANMDTVGFKAQQMLFQEYLVEPKGVDPQSAEPVSMVVDAATFRDITQGAMTRTGNELDLALQGEGYFTLEGPAGDRYTRAGSFHINQDREIVHSSGAPLLAAGGGRLAVPENAIDISIDRNGIVTALGAGAAGAAEQIGQIQLAAFADDQAMTQVAGGLLITDQQPIEPEATTVEQGYLEASNVNSIVEMTRMMEISRSYASTQRMLETEHERMRSSIQTLGTLNA